MPQPSYVTVRDSHSSTSGTEQETESVAVTSEPLDDGVDVPDRGWHPGVMPQRTVVLLDGQLAVDPLSHRAVRGQLGGRGSRPTRARSESEGLFDDSRDDSGRDALQHFRTPL